MAQQWITLLSRGLPADEEGRRGLPDAPVTLYIYNDNLTVVEYCMYARGLSRGALEDQGAEHLWPLIHGVAATQRYFFDRRGCQVLVQRPPAGRRDPHIKFADNLARLANPRRRRGLPGNELAPLCHACDYVASLLAASVHLADRMILLERDARLRTL